VAAPPFLPRISSGLFFLHRPRSLFRVGPGLGRIVTECGRAGQRALNAIQSSLGPLLANALILAFCRLAVMRRSSDASTAFPFPLWTSPRQTERRISSSRPAPRHGWDVSSCRSASVQRFYLCVWSGMPLCRPGHGPNVVVIVVCLSTGSDPALLCCRDARARARWMIFSPVCRFVTTLSSGLRY